MKRLKKAMLLPLRATAYRLNLTKTYYWAENELYALSKVNVMPELYYRYLFRFSMRLVGIRKLRHLADWAIHTIPYNIRFNLA